MKRILINNVTSYNADILPTIIAGVPGHPVEDVKISDVFLHQVGGGSPEMAALLPAEKADQYPEPTMFGDLPAAGLFVRHAKNLEVSNLEVATENEDARPSFYLDDVDGADFFRLKMPMRKMNGQFRLKSVSAFRVFGCQHYPDTSIDRSEDKLV
jgi:polygalacturonase